MGQPGLYGAALPSILKKPNKFLWTFNFYINNLGGLKNSYISSVLCPASRFVNSAFNFKLES